MQVVRVFPDTGSAGTAARVFLNQDITVYFNHPVDPLSVNADTVRVVDDNGNRVVGGLVVGTRSVTFQPIPPVEPTLDDGTFAVDRPYRVEVVGLPLRNALRSQSGQRLARGFVYRFRTVTADPTGFATPFLPEGTVSEALAVHSGFELRMALDVGRLRLHFNRPVLPTSVTPQAAQIIAVSNGKLERLTPKSVRVLPQRCSHELLYGSTLELQFEPSQIDHAPLYFLALDGDGHSRLLDYLGRPLQNSSEPLPISVVTGDRISVKQVGGTQPWRFDPLADGHSVPFAAREGRIEALCHIEAGDGQLGWLRPTSSITIRSGEAFDRGDGTLVRAGDGDFRFLGIDVPAGVTVRFESAAPMIVRSVAPITIDGRVSLATPIAPLIWDQGIRIDIESLTRGSGFTLVSGSHVRVRGTLEHVDGDPPGSPCSILCGGELRVDGQLPAEVVVAMPSIRPILGALESPRRVQCAMTPGVPPSVDQEVVGLTQWIRLPADRPDLVDFEVTGAVGELSAWVHVAPPHSVDASLPDLAAHRRGKPTELGEALSLGLGAFVRFEFRARARYGQPLPSVDSAQLLAR